MAITISDTEPRVQYTATAGQTSFTVPFEFFANADLKVFNGTTQLTFAASPADQTEYSVSGAGQTGGGSITLGAPGATLNDVVTIYRDLAIERTTDFPTSGAFQINSLNTELDKIIAMAQQLERDLKFSPRAAATTANTFDITFPNLVANKVLNVNSAGTGLEFSQDITDITTIAGIASDVTTVSGIAANVTAVANDATDIGTVATNIASVNTVATNIADVITVANDLNEAISEVETVADDLNEAVSEIDTVANNITSVNTVGNSTNIANIGTVAGEITPTNNISTLATISSDITQAATDSADIQTVASDSADIRTLADIEDGTVATNAVSNAGNNSTNIATVAGQISPTNNISTVAAAAPNIATVAGQISPTNNISTVAGANANISTIASDLTGGNTIGTVAADLSGSNTIGTVASNITDVQDVAANISGVNSFAERYRVAASDPTTSLDQGDLAFNTSGSVLKYYDGSAWQTITSGGITDLVQDSTPQLGGNLDLNSNDVTGTGNVNITGNVSLTGTVDGRDVASDGTKLDTIATSATANPNAIDNVVEDLTPQLGGNLDVNGNSIVSVSNGNISITPDGTGKVIIDGLSHPTADGSANQVLKTDGSGNLSFVDQFSGISWQSVQTTGFTASAGNGYPCNTTSGGFTVTLPASPSAGDQVQIVDYAGTFDTNGLVIDPGSNNLEGSTTDLQLDVEREGVILTYIDATQGWIATSGINEGTDALGPVSYSLDFLVVAGGGSGGSSGGGGSGGGAGGFRTSTQTVIPGTAITVTVGDGGAAPSTAAPSNDGSDSSISGSGLTTITSAGGGGGASPNHAGRSGGSGGGGAGTTAGSGAYQVGGSGNTPSTSPSQGNDGGTASAPFGYNGAGGGGAGAAGTSNIGADSGTAGSGGNGTASSITGSSVTYAGGGGGAVYNGTIGTGGTGGGGDGGKNLPSAVLPQDGTDNLGGGGGGYRDNPAAAGGKGVVILSMPTSNYSGTTTGSPGVSTSGSNTILTFNGSGSYTA
jgi:hypothetical protein